MAALYTLSMSNPDPCSASCQRAAQEKEEYGPHNQARGAPGVIRII